MKRHGYSKKGKYLLPCLSSKQMKQRLRYCIMHRGEKFELWIDIDEKVSCVSFIAYLPAASNKKIVFIFLEHFSGSMLSRNQGV